MHTGSLVSLLAEPLPNNENMLSFKLLPGHRRAMYSGSSLHSHAPPFEKLASHFALNHGILLLHGKYAQSNTYLCGPGFKVGGGTITSQILGL